MRIGKDGLLEQQRVDFSYSLEKDTKSDDILVNLRLYHQKDNKVCLPNSIPQGLLPEEDTSGYGLMVRGTDLADPDQDTVAFIPNYNSVVPRGGWLSSELMTKLLAITYSDTDPNTILNIIPFKSMRLRFNQKDFSESMLNPKRLTADPDSTIFSADIKRDFNTEDTDPLTEDNIAFLLSNNDSSLKIIAATDFKEYGRVGNDAIPSYNPTQVVPTSSEAGLMVSTTEYVYTETGKVSTRVAVYDTEAEIRIPVEESGSRLKNPPSVALIRFIKGDDVIASQEVNDITNGRDVWLNVGRMNRSLKMTASDDAPTYDQVSVIPIHRYIVREKMGIDSGVLYSCSDTLEDINMKLIAHKPLALKDEATLDITTIHAKRYPELHKNITVIKRPPTVMELLMRKEQPMANTGIVTKVSGGPKVS